VKEKKNIYFISDLHLGLYPLEKSAVREKIVVDFLDQIRDDAAELYLMGDIFDFWHEYKHVVPKGFTRFLGRLAMMADSGTRLHFFTGNHDIWAYGYFTEELGMKIYRQPLVTTLHGKKFFLAHGDGLGRGDNGYKLLKWFFTNKFLQFCFARLHPNFALWIGKTWSKNSRYSKGIVAEEFAGEEGELQIQFAKEELKHHHYDYFVFGHRHIPSVITLGEKTQVINLGDWIYSFTYAVLEGDRLSLRSFTQNHDPILYKHYPNRPSHEN